jgi:hypothetical protein
MCIYTYTFIYICIYAYKHTLHLQGWMIEYPCTGSHGLDQDNITEHKRESGKFMGEYDTHICIHVYACIYM